MAEQLGVSCSTLTHIGSAECVTEIAARAMERPGCGRAVRRAGEGAMPPIYADLFSFAFVPNWYLQLDELAELALPEPWRFRQPIFESKNAYTPILE